MATQPASGSEAQRLFTGLTKWCHSFFDASKSRFDALEARIAELEAQQTKSGVPYQGVYQSGLHYERGQFVTHQGSLWHCDRDTYDRPGQGDWTLAVKRGRDGKDER